MSKRIKVLISVLVVIPLLAVGATAIVMAQEESTPTPEAGAKGLLARVAEILDVPEEDLTNAFKQAQQEVRHEAFIRSLDRAVEQGRIAPDEADQIKEWWEQKPEVIGTNLFPRTFGFSALRGRHMWGGHMWSGYKGYDLDKAPEPAD